jgi:hypothetical protein
LDEYPQHIIFVIGSKQAKYGKTMLTDDTSCKYFDLYIYIFVKDIKSLDQFILIKYKRTVALNNILNFNNLRFD